MRRWWTPRVVLAGVRLCGGAVGPPGPAAPFAALWLLRPARADIAWTLRALAAPSCLCVACVAASVIGREAPVPLGLGPL
ncbi:MAG: hypothetical protein ACK559_20585 [bacterium]